MRYAEATDDFYVPSAEAVRTQVGTPGAYSFEPVSPELAEHTQAAVGDAYDVAYTTYRDLIDKGVAREVARSVLPVGAYTEFYWTVNARALMNFLSLRSHGDRTARDPRLRRADRAALREPDAGDV